MTWNAASSPIIPIPVTEFDAAVSRPVYILGAGLSFAISDHMPLTNELGKELQTRLAGVLDIDLAVGQTFEEWLTIQTTSMPFLEGYENSQRQANAARVIAEIASILDERIELATAGTVPRWLRQLLSIWDSEQAVVLTFNYDTLVERAVNTDMPVTGLDRGYLQHIQGDYLAFPAPPAPAPQMIGDPVEGHSDKSFQLLKLHGSINWYWANGDPNGTTLVRVRDRHVFESTEPLAHDADYSATTTLDRYLIPPLTSKEGYYGTYLANGMWRRARGFISDAPSLTLLGYSLPPEDRVTNQLIAQLPAAAGVHIVNPRPEPVEDTLAKLGAWTTTRTDGEDCTPTFVQDQITARAATLGSASAFSELKSLDATVVVGVTQGWNAPNPVQMFTPALYQPAQAIKLHWIDAPRFGSQQAPHEVVFDQLPPGLKPHTTMLTADRVLGLTSGGVPLQMLHPHTGELIVAIGARRFEFNDWEALELKWALA